ncbi:class I SAM-dependent methyltransferase [Latilactobacillus graminis]|uniref:N-6 DNA Methylase family protein n=1 Tax=Latilactobacillus graminis DSM 20719 TaxID=1423752 RepID=A0AA89I6J0_9LACO|nr:class I SAM-dependent methyltransferase [Latilactobacillus graminis]KRM21219.1 N-6 DNA Methylase family protein [Latilactobacillus graminis DSM 20719]
MAILPKSAVETLFDQLDQTAQLIEKNLETTYLDALTETIANIADGGRVKVEAGLPDVQTIAQLEPLYAAVKLSQFDAEEIRQALQLATLKGLRQVKVEPNKQMTPDAIGYLVAYLAEVFGGANQIKTVLDPVVGTGNLLATVINHIQKLTGNSVQGFGVDNDDSLLEIAGISSELQKHKATFFHQDALDPLLIKPVDIAVADLPIGFYPIDERAADFETHAVKGHSFAHHLLIEQTMHYVKDGGYGFFLVPNVILETDEAKQLIKWVTKHVYLQGLLSLPTNLFKTKAGQKAILVLQKQGSDARQAQQVLLGEFPNSNDQKAFATYLQKIRTWQKENLQ